MNQITITGRLTEDPSLKQTRSGLSVCALNVAVNREKTRDNSDPGTDYFSVPTWREAAENHARYLHKGDRVLVTGRMESRSYEDRNGEKRTVWEINGAKVEYLSERKERQSETRDWVSTGQRVTGRPARQETRDMYPADDDDLPF